MKTFIPSLTTPLFCWIALLIITGTTNCFGQDTIRHYPELKKKGNAYMYGDKQLNEREMQAQLVLLGNAEITEQLKLAKKAKELQKIGYYAIPLGLFATYLGIRSQPIFWNPYDRQTEKMSQLCYGATFLAISSSVYFKMDSNKKNARALRLYKEYYGNR